jgi:glycine/sarcosine N-methyltransferase
MFHSYTKNLSNNTIYNLHESPSFSAKLANHWHEFVSCEKRLNLEAPFLLSVCGSPAKSYILDAATGIGCESIFLLKSGYEVVSNEIDENLLSLAINNAKNEGINLKLKKIKWENFLSEYKKEYFDNILLLGNSICLVTSASDRRKCLKNFWQLLAKGGKLIIDERNFDYIFNNRVDILRGKFRYSRKIMYCGEIVKGRPIKISSTNIIFGYFHKEFGLIGMLHMYPFKKGELKKLLVEVGFQHVWEVYDFGLNSIEKCDFITYVAIK